MVSRVVDPVGHEVPRNACLSCGKLHDRASGVDDPNPPEPGDVTICINCGHLMAFDEQIKFRELNDEEMVAIAGNPVVLDVQRARAAVQRDRGK